MIDSVGTKILTNYPSFDTLVFKSEFPGSNNPIICNFKLDTTYYITVACCGSLDIIPTSKLKNDSLNYWDFEKDFVAGYTQFGTIGFGGSENADGSGEAFD